MSPFKVCCIVILLLLTNGAAAVADTIVLSNDDRITGQVKKLDSTTLTVTTEYAGELKIQRPAVARVHADAPFDLYTQDGRRFTATRIVFDGPHTGAWAEDGTPVLDDPDEVAFINHDPMAPVVTASADLGWSMAKGNSDSSALHLDADLKVRHRENRYRFKGDLNRVEEDDQTAEENWTTTFTYDRFLSSRVFATAQAAYESDRLAGLRLRQTYGLGLGYIWWDDDRGRLETEAGGAYVIERFEDQADDAYPSGRWAVDFGWWIWPDRLELFHLHDGTVSLEEPDNVIVDSETGLRIPMWRHLHMTLQVDADWRSRPPQGSSAWDHRYLTTIGFSY